MREATRDAEKEFKQSLDVGKGDKLGQDWVYYQNAKDRRREEFWTSLYTTLCLVLKRGDLPSFPDVDADDDMAHTRHIHHCGADRRYQLLCRQVEQVRLLS